MSVDTILARLQGVRKNGAGWTARCPAHSDDNPSLSISAGNSGNVLIRCHAGCTTKAIVKTIGLQMTDLFPAKERNNGDEKRIVAEYGYHDETGKLLFQCVRFTPKGFRQRRPNGNGGWLWNLRGVPRVLYRLPELLAVGKDATVFVCEGEKDVDRLVSLGLVATTCPMGAGKWHLVDDGPLHGRQVVILPDRDEPGRKHAKQVAMSLRGKAKSVRIVKLPGLPVGGDVSDFIEAHDSRESDDIRRMIEAIADETQEWRPADTIEEGDAPDALEWRPFPVEVLPEPLQTFVSESSTAIGCDPSMIALPVLAVCASVIGTTHRIQLKRSWSEPSVLWTAIVAESGTLKSPALDCATQSLRAIQADRFNEYASALAQYEQDTLRYETDLAAWKRPRKDERGDPPERPAQPVCVRHMVSDVTVESLAPILSENLRGVLLCRDELSGWLSGFNQYKSGKGSDVAQWLECHRAGTVTVDRKTGTRIIHVPRAAVSICGTIQPGVMRRALTQEYFENGMAARLLLAMPPNRRKHWTEADVSQSTVDRFADVIRRLIDLQHGADGDGEAVPVDVPLSPEGRKAWIAFYGDFAERQHDATGDFAATLSKLEGYAARFALINHAVRSVTIPGFPDDGVGVDSVAFGSTLAKWFAHEAERIYSCWHESDEDRDRRELVSFIESRVGTVSARDLQRAGPCFKSAEDARSALNALVAYGFGAWESPRPSAKGGHPSKRFRLQNGKATDTTPAESIENDGSVSVSSVNAPDMTTE